MFLGTLKTQAGTFSFETIVYEDDEIVLEVTSDKGFKKEFEDDSECVTVDISNNYAEIKVGGALVGLIGHSGYVPAKNIVGYKLAGEPINGWTVRQRGKKVILVNPNGRIMKEAELPEKTRSVDLTRTGRSATDLSKDKPCLIVSHGSWTDLKETILLK